MNLLQKLKKIFIKDPNEEIVETLTIFHRATTTPESWKDSVMRFDKRIKDTADFLNISYVNTLNRTSRDAIPFSTSNDYERRIVLTIKGTRKNVKTFSRGIGA